MRAGMVIGVMMLTLAGFDGVALGKRVHGVPVPARRTKVKDAVYTSRLTFRRTIQYYQRYLKARKIPHTAVPIYRYRGVLVARWISKRATTPWLAIHVFSRRTKTSIFIVPRPPTPKKS